MIYGKCISVGKIVKPIGIKGMVKVLSLTDYPERFKPGNVVCLYDEKKMEFVSHSESCQSSEFKIDRSESGNGFYRIGFEGVNRIEEASLLTGTFLVIDEDQKRNLEDGRHYYHELIGLEVFDSDRPLGKIESVVDYGSGDLLRIDSQGKEILIPYIDEFVRSVDVEKGRVDVELIEGFI